MRRMRVAWVGIGVLTLVVLAVGLWLQQRVTEQLSENVRDNLASLRDASAEALSAWMQAQEAAASLAVTDERVLGAARSILEEAARGASLDELGRMKEQEVLQSELRAVSSIWGFRGYLVLHQGRVVAADDLSYLGAKLGKDDQRRVNERLLARDSFLVPPKMMEAPRGDGRGDGRPVMWVASALKVEHRAMGVIGFRIDPARDFSRILHLTRPGQSGEVYAFDRSGVLLSSIRFAQKARDAGVIEPEQDPILHLSIRAPSHSRARLEDGAGLTDAVQSAVRGRTGESIRGYANYLGDEVVGAWTWFPDYDLGLVVEMSRGEAFTPTTTIKKSFAVLVLGLACLTILLLVSAVWARRLHEKVQTLGQYTLERKIGEGGMGTVYLAHHALLRRPTAIKMIKASELDQGAQKRFSREVHTTSKLNHPHTITIFDFGRTDQGVFYYAMEYLSGINLSQLVEKQGPLPAARVAYVLVQVCGALSEAHGLGLVHRDIKPSNIMLCNLGGEVDFVKVLDFGLVKVTPYNDPDVSALTMDTSLTGTPHYIAPEVIVDSTKAEPRSDLYSIGAVGFYLLTGRVLFPANNVVAVLTRHMTEAPPSLDSLTPSPVPARLQKLLLECLEKDPSDRPESAARVREELEGILSECDPGWSEGEAEAWWETHRELVEPRQKQKAPSRAITVDLGARSRSS